MNDVSEFTLSRPFHKGKKDKDNEFAVRTGFFSSFKSLFEVINTRFHATFHDILQHALKYEKNLHDVAWLSRLEAS